MRLGNTYFFQLMLVISIILFCGNLFSQNNTVPRRTSSELLTLDCNYYRDVMDLHMDLKGIVGFKRAFIVGDSDRYYNPGMSLQFVSEPKVPDYMYTLDKSRIDADMLAIMEAHVDLYHCDVIERRNLELAPTTQDTIIIVPQAKEELLADENYTDELVLFPNPTDGLVNIKPTELPINRILIYDSGGRFQQELGALPNHFDLSGQKPGLYFVYFLMKRKIIVERVILK